jgi:hypothetical protein
MESIKGAQILRERFAERRAEQAAEAEDSADEHTQGGSELVARISAWTRASSEGSGSFDPPAEEF